MDNKHLKDNKRELNVVERKNSVSKTELIIIKKYYSLADSLFHVVKAYPPYNFGEKDTTFNNFDKFYEAVNRDLTNADLLHYDFKKEDIQKYNFNGAKLSSETQIKLGVYCHT